MSTTYARAIIVLLCLAWVPSLVQSAVGSDVDDGWRANAVASRLGAIEGVPTRRQATWVQRRFASTDFTERTYGSTRLFIVRSYDFTSLYHHPELAVAYRTGTAYAGVTTWTEGGRTLPVHVVRPGPGQRGLGAYVLLYGRERFVERPYWFHVRLTGELLLRARQPMTLFFVYDETAPPTSSLEDAPPLRLLVEAIKSFQEQDTSRTGASRVRFPSAVADPPAWRMGRES